MANGSAQGEAIIDECDLASLAAIEAIAAQRAVRQSRTFGDVLALAVLMSRNWSDERIVELIAARFPNAAPAQVQRQIIAVRNSRIELLDAN